MYSASIGFISANHAGGSKARENLVSEAATELSRREEANIPVRLYDWTLCLVLSVHLKRPDNKTSSLTRSPAVPHTRCLLLAVRTHGVRTHEFSFDVALPSTPVRTRNLPWPRPLGEMRWPRFLLWPSAMSIFWDELNCNKVWWSKWKLKCMKIIIKLIFLN